MPASLFDRRLHFVVGKGGVGKTIVAASLALLLASRGRRTLAIELEGDGKLAGFLGAPGGTSYTPRPLGPDLHALDVDGKAALEEYLGLIIPVKRLLSTVFSSTVYQYFVAAAPGLKELMSVGKVWYEATRRDGDRPAWDAVVVDAPATGHSLQLLRMPEAARVSFGAGLVQREAAKIMDLLRDAHTTAVHLVTVGEDMPVTETLETREELARLQLPLGAIVLNRLHRRRFDAAVLDRAVAGAAPADRALVTCVVERAREESGWSDINAAHEARLREAVGTAPIIELPFLFVEEFGQAEVAALSERVGAGLGARGAVARGRRA
jgi:anion-transporting  ArsA/GET3 family ATPase